MTDFTTFVGPQSLRESPEASIQAASGCLDRFTACFNACDAVGVDAELHFPHLMLSGSSRIEWLQPGGHPPDFFEALKRSGWHHTCYEARHAVLAARDKVHFVVTYSRHGADDAVLSVHTLWIVVRIDERWGICLRSY